MVLLIGDVTEADLKSSPVKHVTHLREVRGLADGALVEFFGHVVRWDNRCASEEQCLLWRSMADPSCDAALDAMFKESSYIGKDLLESLENHSDQRSAPDAASAFLEEVSNIPPEDIRVDPRDVLIARDFFLDYSIQIMQALFHYSLAGGFASPRIVKTLRAVSYLMPPTRQDDGVEQESKAADDRTFARLLETTQFVLDVMGCVASSADAESTGKSASDAPDSYLLPGGEGWKACIRVRMLHGIARRRVRQRLARESAGSYNEAYEGVPISQEDMAATLASFSTVPIWALKRLHLRPAPAQVRAYLALWRHVGFYLGVAPSILRQYLHTPSAADQFLASATLSLFSSNAPLDPRTLPTLPILRAAAHRPPGGASLAHNCAVTRLLVGGALADHLGLPRTPPLARVRLYAALAVQALPVLFARCYPRAGWRAKRRAVMREGLPRSVRWSLDMLELAACQNTRE
ncbi:DUF2236 domain-containing protein [Phanerochaete sordida]|uniref:DUF2236 domain-containing protein n=1 Tax=Phanerochaete sordida TaxID=48140 RepID=A0A9P3LI84_9APHY|nr:DUF2236 domain-containing protein [Phanerochaete sordida]